MRASISIPLLLLASISGGCGVAHISPYEPRQRNYIEPELDARAEADTASGSLWNRSGGAGSLFTDVRAYRRGDLLMVRVEEKAAAKREADTTLARSAETDLAVTNFLGLVARLQTAGIQPALGGTASTSFDARGSTSRTENVAATVPAFVRKVLQNGNLFIEGHRVILVNQEEQHFYISGVVRPIDIDQDNSVKSERIADAEIEFTGRGVMTDTQRQGWLSRFVGWFWPF